MLLRYRILGFESGLSASVIKCNMILCFAATFGQLSMTMDTTVIHRNTIPSSRAKTLDVITLVSLRHFILVANQAIRLTNEQCADV